MRSSSAASRSSSSRCDLALRERLEREVRERGAAPERERLAEQARALGGAPSRARRDEPLEAAQVELVAVDAST